MYAFLDADRNVMATSTLERTIATVQVKVPTVTTRIDAAPSTLKPKGSCSKDEVQFHRLKEGEPGTDIEDYDVYEDLTALKAYRVAQVTVKNDELFAKGATYDGKTFAITKDEHAGWLSILVMKDALSYPYQVYSINPPAGYSLANADAVVALVAALFARCSWIYASGQVIDDAVNAAATKEAVDAIVDDRE